MSCGVLKETITEFENALESRTEDIADKVACLSYFEYGMQILNVITGRKYHPDFLWRDATLFLKKADKEKTVEDIWKDFFKAAREEKLTDACFEEN